MTEGRNTNYYAVDGLIMQGEHMDVSTPVKIALDHGWSSIKGEHIFMENLVTPVDYTPLTNNGLLEYRGRKYIIGQGRMGKQATKTENDNYFLLTLAGIAKELSYQRIEKTTHVELYAGVPLTMFGAERKAFREYLWHKEQLSFTFEGVHYCFYLDKVKIYAQCYAAIANRMGDMNRLRCVDLGSWTMDVLSVKDKVPMDKDAYTYEVGLITAFERIKKEGLPKVHCEIPEEDITDYIKGNITSVNDEFIPIIEKGLQEYADNVEAKLREIKVDLKHENIIYVGGGASVMKKFGRTKGMNIQYVTDVKANAIGYRYLADNIG
ncbi:ParM/StbA family protein [Velocimicrobium porci]|uniref:ParM/StbA family protein n=1 Tax=Velocimicrobium porci TaxID=2606634 RepID=A0A6L5Y131_9FIRM|nr:ParM/StbA family protein [Velocimicrobium porci]MSS64860.1 ParM/StbA family protein [Velocimicrobium porci]